MNVNDSKTVVVAMSGGVDSSTVAALLVERGYNVIGLMMRLWSESIDEKDSFRLDVAAIEHFASNRCCSPEAVADARGVCQKLGIPFYLLNFENDFKTQVVDFFLDGYARGVTPNPCLQCNRQLKFGTLLDKARSLGADYLATGHYARVSASSGKVELLRGVDPKKDQSYALSMLTQTQLMHTLFPLGEFTKDQTREMARQFGLNVAEKHESQDLCFIADGDYRAFLRRRIPSALTPGEIVDTHGNVIGTHEGLGLFTIGQRKGLGIAIGEPLYVIALDAVTNRVVVGEADELGKRELFAGNVNWIAGEPPSQKIRVTAKIRYRASEMAATVFPLSLRAERSNPQLTEGDCFVTSFDSTKNHRSAQNAPHTDSVRVAFDTPLRDITPGQAVVFYDGNKCLGGGIIQQ
jgi:tRNA-specific 2-thiouridylase